jgi:hypothetical protein
VLEVDVEVHHIELRRLLEHLVEHHGVPHQPVGAARVQPQAARHHRHQPRGGARIAAGEQRHVMAECDQGFSQV